MATVMVATGKKGSGAQEWMARWYGQNPEERRIVKTPRDLVGFLAAGKDVAVEIINVDNGGAAYREVQRLAARQGAIVELVRVA